jgi:hypothetical protein
MVIVRSLLRRLRRARPRSAALILVALGVGLGALATQRLPLLTGSKADPWPGGRLTYFDASGSSAAVDAAARRWNDSGANVQLERAGERSRADVVFVADRERLRSTCGARCLALSSTIGRPRDGRAATVMLNPDITGEPNTLSVWVAMHELGHILGLRHREGTCSLMNAHAYDKACRSGGAKAAHGRLPCGPASGDVAAAARLYGRAVAARPCR